uniref:SOCS box domain-containing protein n=2 Tax=Trichobilharzia regenti TaxID=157069 RepID=A0AA85IVA5_TRIRE|nr:unnamed protein product [Trichobilharzia regenti]
MGLEESKIGQPNKTTCNAPNLCFFAPVLPGRIVHQCTLELWRKSHRGNQMASLVYVKNLHFKSVLDIHSGLAVVHLARDMITQFALVDLRINKFLGSFGRQTVLFSPESTIGKISPDGTYCLVRLPWSRNRRVYILKLYNLRNSELISELPLSNASNYEESSSTNSRLPLAPYQEHNRQYSNIRTSCDNVHSPSSSSSSGSMNPELRGTSQNENQLQLGPARSSQVLFAFDPRFVNSRIAITNVDFPHTVNSHKSSSNWLPGMQATLSLVKLPTWECLASTNKLCSWSPLSNRTGPSYVVNNNTSSSTSTSTRETGRRRRSSDANHHAGNSPNSPNTFSNTFPHVMSIFYSRDGYFLFTITTESRVCRCSVIDNHSHSANSLLSSETSSYADDVCHTPNTSRFSSNSTTTATTTTTTESGRNQQRVLNSTQSVGESTSRYTSKTNNASSPMLAPTLPGCTTLWLTIFNSDTLERLRILRFDRAICPIHTCPTNYLPVMSRCGARIALITRQTVGLYNNNSYNSNQSINVNSRECLLSSCKNIPASLRHSVPSINVDACCDSQWVSTKGSSQEMSKENSGRRNELKKQQAINSQAYIFNQPRNLNLSHHLSTSLPSPLSKVHLSSGSGGGGGGNSPFNKQQITGCSTSELTSAATPTAAGVTTSSSQHRPMTTSSFDSSFISSSSSSSSRYHSSSVNPSGTTVTTPTPTTTTNNNNYSGVINISNTMTNPSVQIDVLLVYQLPPPPKLQALARQRIRQLCKDEHLEHLDLPRRIISYLRFEPSYTCAGSCFSRSNSSTRTIRSDSFDL